MKIFRLFMSSEDEFHKDSPAPWYVEAKSIYEIQSEVMSNAGNMTYYWVHWLTKIKAIVECPYDHFPYNAITK